MFVKPAEGIKIRDPFKKDHLPPEGREVADGDLYWERARIAGDVTVIPPVQASAPSESSRKPSRTTQPVDRSIEQ